MPNDGGWVSDKWVRLGVFSNRVEAEMARGALDARGIEARVVGDDAGGAHLPMSLEHTGMEVHVAAEDVAVARRLLDGRPTSSPPKLSTTGCEGRPTL